MWAYQLTRPGSFERVETASPAAAGGTLLRVLAGGICGSDLPFFAGRVSSLWADDRAVAPGAPGYPLHEVVGEVVTSDDPALPVGARAVGWATNTDAIAECVVTESASLMRVPEDYTDSQALTLQPLACVTETVRKLGDLSGLRVAVLGLGPFGLLFCHVAKSAGAEVVVGVDRVDRSDVASRFRLDEFVHSASDRWAATIREDERPDLVIEAVGHQTGTIGDGLRALRFGGRLFFFGVPDEAVYPIPLELMFRGNLTLVGGFVTERRRCLEAADEYLRRFPDLHDSLVTHSLPVAEVETAFALSSLPATGRLKVQLRYA